MAYPDFRAICAELVNEMQYFGPENEYSTSLLEKAKRALLASRLNPLTDDQLEEIFNQNANCIAGKSHLDLQGFIKASREALTRSSRTK